MRDLQTGRGLRGTSEPEGHCFCLASLPSGRRGDCVALCELEAIMRARALAGVAKNLQECPPLAGGVQLVRLSILEGDDLTLGSVTSSVKDGGRSRKPSIQLLTSYMKALLQERVTGDGRHQCMWQDCMKMEEGEEEEGRGSQKLFRV